MPTKYRESQVSFTIEALAVVRTEIVVTEAPTEVDVDIPFTASGLIRRIGGSPIPGLTIQLWDGAIGTGTLMGITVSDSAGEFTFSVTFTASGTHVMYFYHPEERMAGVTYGESMARAFAITPYTGLIIAIPLAVGLALLFTSSRKF